MHFNYEFKLKEGVNQNNIMLYVKFYIFVSKTKSIVFNIVHLFVVLTSFIKTCVFSKRMEASTL